MSEPAGPICSSLPPSDDDLILSFPFSVIVALMFSVTPARGEPMIEMLIESLFVALSVPSEWSVSTMLSPEVVECVSPT